MLMKRRILVVEDDAAIRQGILDALTFAGYATFEAADGVEGKRMADECEVDLVLLDLVMPRCGGLEVLEHVRAESPTLPVVILTAMGDESDRVKGLKLGADDYVVKPFSVRELIARVEAVLRRSPERPRAVSTITANGATIDFERCEVRFDDGERSELSERELELLQYLTANPGRAVSRDEILQRVWRLNPSGVQTRTIDMHIARLREKLRDGSEPKLLLTVRGKGYMFGQTQNDE